MLTKKLYEQATGRSQKSNIIAYQIRQSFRPGEITAEEANRIGYELASRFLKGKHAFIVAAHTYQEHILNRILTQIPYHLEFYSAKSHTQHNTVFKQSINKLLSNQQMLPISRQFLLCNQFLPDIP